MDILFKLYSFTVRTVIVNVDYIYWLITHGQSVCRWYLDIVAQFQ